MITVVDYHMGNIGSIANMLTKIGAKAKVSSDADVLRNAEKLVLPGVGHFDRGIANLTELGLVPILEELVLERRVPVLGICLGMQLMCSSSEEGERPGLGWIDAKVRRFDESAFPDIKVPHMGWNRATPKRASSLFPSSQLAVGDANEPPRFYFVHSYFVDCSHAEDVTAKTSHGLEFCSAFEHQNILGVQFHPEKSHAFGMALFRNFVSG